MDQRYELLLNSPKENELIHFNENEIQVSYEFIKETTPFPYNIEEMLIELESERSFRQATREKVFYFAAAGSGILCALIDQLIFNSSNHGNRSDKISEIIDRIVGMIASSLGCKNKDTVESLNFINQKFGGSKNKDIQQYSDSVFNDLHLLSDRADMIGLAALMLSNLYDQKPDEKNGFIMKSQTDISIEERFLTAAVDWFLNIIVAMKTGKKFAGTGIPGNVIELGKKLSELPFFETISVDQGKINSLKHKMIENLLLSFRKNHSLHSCSESVESSRIVPVLLNETFVRVLSGFQSLYLQLKQTNPLLGKSKLSDLDWRKISLQDKNQTEILLFISAAAFTATNLTDVCIESYRNEKFLWMRINIPNLISLTVHTGNSIKIISDQKQLDETIKALQNEKNYFCLPSQIERENQMRKFWFGENSHLSHEMIELLYNLESYKTVIDIERTNNPIALKDERKLKIEWLNRWKSFVEEGAPYLGLSDSIEWYSKEEMIRRIESYSPWDPWFSRIIFKAMKFRPYFPLITDRKRGGSLWRHHRYDSIYKMCHVRTLDNVFDQMFLEKIYWDKNAAGKMRRDYDDLLIRLKGGSADIVGQVLSIVPTAADTIASFINKGNSSGSEAFSKSPVSMSDSESSRIAAENYQILAAVLVQIKYADNSESSRYKASLPELQQRIKRFCEEQECEIDELREQLLDPNSDSQKINKQIAGRKSQLKEMQRVFDILFKYLNG